jgi:hypothetical protein
MGRREFVPPESLHVEAPNAPALPAPPLPPFVPPEDGQSAVTMRYNNQSNMTMAAIMASGGLFEAVVPPTPR